MDKPLDQGVAFKVEKPGNLAIYDLHGNPDGSMDGTVSGNYNYHSYNWPIHFILIPGH